MLLLKEEHEIRYARLLWLTAQLKSEVYWMERIWKISKGLCLTAMTI